jgi:hypothetical protein
MTTTATPLLPDAAEAEVAWPTRSWSGREQAKRYRGLLAVLVAMALVVVGALAISRYSSAHGTMDPESYDPAGGRALATLLTERGVPVTRLTGVDQVLAAAKPGSTVVVAEPDAEQDLSPLRRAPAGVTIVLIAPDEGSLAALQPGLDAVDHLEVKAKEVDCSQPDAVLAGVVFTGGDSNARRPLDPVPCRARSTSSTSAPR